LRFVTTTTDSGSRSSGRFAISESYRPLPRITIPQSSTPLATSICGSQVGLACSP
jgi:hypothetical protein